MEFIEKCRKVKDLMNYSVITVPEYAKVIDVVKILSKGNVHGVVVVGKDGKVSGVVSEIDVSRAFGRDMRNVNAKEIMSKPIKSIDPNETICDAAKIMRETGFDRLVILDKNDFPMGMLSITDIIRGFSDAYFKK